MVSPELFNAAAKGEIATVQNWLVEGGDPNQAIEQAIHHDGSSYDPGSTLVMAAASRARLEVLRRLGHSYKRWVLKDYMALLRVRSLLARGRARHGPETTVVVARLFESLNGFADVPGPCFWRVVEYAWLGEWRK